MTCSERQGRKRLVKRVPLLVAIACVSIGTASAQARAARWSRFHDRQTGLSFRYPPDLRIRRRDPRKFNLPAVHSIVELVGDTRANPGTVVLRFLVKRGNTSSAEREKRREFLRSGCSTSSPMMIGGHEAVVCVSAASAAVRWSVEILQPRECTIVTLLGGADAAQALPPPHDGEFPLLSIIRTVRFVAASKLSKR